ncbi:MAG: hypothetical protein ACOY16_00945 [Chloroflexota bacterium]
MNKINNFFQSDLPQIFSASKWKMELFKLHNQVDQLEKQKSTLLNELGMRSWLSKIRDDNTNELFVRLEKIDESKTIVQHELDDKLSKLQIENEKIQKITGESEKQIQEINNKRQISIQKINELSLIQNNLDQEIKHLQSLVNQKSADYQNIQTQINQSQKAGQLDQNEKVDSLFNILKTLEKEIEMAKSQIAVAISKSNNNSKEQTLIEKEIKGYNHLIAIIDEKKRSEVGNIQERQKLLQNDITKLMEKKKSIDKQISEIIPILGERVFESRPQAKNLNDLYEQIDQINNKVKEINRQIYLIEARLKSIDTKVIFRLLFVLGLFVFVPLMLLLLYFVIFNLGRNVFKVDPRNQVRLIQSYTLYNCSDTGSIIDISIWKNNKRDSLARVSISNKLMGENNLTINDDTNTIYIAPEGIGVQFSEMDPKGSNVKNVQRSVDSVTFSNITTPDINNITIKPVYKLGENPLSSNSDIEIGLDIYNNSAFGILPIIDNSFIFSIDKNNNLLDVRIIPFSVDLIVANSISSIYFYRLNYECLNYGYMPNNTTLWYIISFGIGTSNRPLITLSGKESYNP